MPGQGGSWKCEQPVGITLVLYLNHPRPGAGRTLGVTVVVQSPAEHSPLATPRCLGSAVPQPYRGAQGLVLSQSPPQPHCHASRTHPNPSHGQRPQFLITDPLNEPLHHPPVPALAPQGDPGSATTFPWGQHEVAPASSRRGWE